MIFERLWRDLVVSGREDFKQDLKALHDITIDENGKPLTIRSECLGCCGKVFKAVGVAIPPAIRENVQFTLFVKEQFVVPRNF